MIQSRDIPFHLLERELLSISLPKSGCWNEFKACHQYEAALTVIRLFFWAVLKCHILIALQSFVAFMNREVVIYSA